MPVDHSTETFLSVPYFPGYRVSNRGRVQSCWKRGRYPAMTNVWHDLKLQLHDAGYRYVRLSRSKEEIRRYVHEVVLTTFFGDCPSDQLCRHMNGDPADNRWPENICWGTQAENWEDMRRHGRAMVGETHYAAKVTEDDVRTIRSLAEDGMFQDEIGRRFGLSQASITDIVRRKNWASVA